MNTNGKYENINTNRKHDIGKKKRSRTNSSASERVSAGWKNLLDTK